MEEEMVDKVKRLWTWYSNNSKVEEIPLIDKIFDDFCDLVNDIDVFEDKIKMEDREDERGENDSESTT